jgi:CHAT domain-containing protein/tetratricopeptide (TPR) repeat protein
MTPSEVRAANDRVASLVAAGRHAEGLAQAAKLLSVVSAAHAPPHPAVALQLQILAFAQRSAEQPEALDTLHKALSMRIDLFGPDHSSIGATLRELALTHHVLGNAKLAVEHYRQAVSIWERALPADHPFLKQAPRDLALLDKTVGGYQPVAAALAAYQRGQRERAELQYNAAQASFELAVELNRKELGHDHPDVSRCLRELALLHKDLEQLGRAIPLLREAHYISEQHRERLPRDYAISLADLALVLTKADQHTEALELFDEVLPLVEPYRPSEFSALVTSHYGALLRDLGRHDEAEAALEDALAELGRIAPPPDRVLEHRAIMHSNLSSLAADRGRYREAIQHDRTALELKMQVFGAGHPSYARTLLKLAIIYSNAGDDRRAAETADEALAILRGSAGSTEAELARALMDVARQAKNPSRRASLCDEAIAIFDSWGDEGVEVSELRLEASRIRGDSSTLEGARQLSDLRAKKLPAGHFKAIDADLTYAALLVQEAFAAEGPLPPDALREAERYLDRVAARGLDDVLSVYQATICLEQKALAVAVTRAPEAAMSLIRRAMARHAEDTAQVFLIASERHRLDHAANFARIFGSYFSIFSSLTNPQLDDIADAATVLLNNKILGIDLAVRRPGASDDDPRAAQLRSLKARMAERMIAGFGVDADETARELEGLATQRDQLEAELAESGHDVRNAHAPVTPQEIGSTLHAGEAVIDYVIFRDVRHAWNSDYAERDLTYGAFVYRSNRPVAYVELGAAAELQKDIARLVEAVGRPTSTSAPDPVRELLGRRVARRLMTPIMPLVEGCTHLYVAPDSGLWAVPYDALPLGTDGLVVDRFLVSHLSSPRDLVAPRADHEAGAAVIIAAPDFDLHNPDGRRLDAEISDRVWGNQALLQSGGGAQISYKGARPDAPELPTYAPLPGTRAEAAAIATRLGVAAILGAAATKQVVLALQSPEVLHIASHGYFFGPGGWDDINLGRLASATSFNIAETMAALSQLTGQMRGILDSAAAGGFARGGSAREDPMAHSGIVLAGANTWLRRGALADGAGDGHVTSHDLAALDLRGTRLVVLSCCDSARAAPEQHAGVFGLRRAFVMAGAGDLVVSLWRVADEHTATLMTAFYDALAHGMAPTQALRTAKLEIRRTYADPYYWAAFTCQVRRTEALLTAKERL